MIEKVSSKQQLHTCLDIIQRSFITVADEFHLTPENCPNHTAFMKPDKLEKQYDRGAEMFLYRHNGACVGFFSLVDNGDSVELNHLSVLPEFRYLGIGREMVEFAKTVTAEHMRAGRITVGMMEENTVLKRWYESLGFLHTGTKRFDGLPFTVGFMELPL